jgi:HK97 family phage prohead protease
MTIRKLLDTNIDAPTGEEIEAVITTESIDRDGEVLISQGMDTTEFDKNPIVFYNHDYAQPIGRVTQIKRGHNKIDATIEFAKRPDGFEGAFFPDFVKALVGQGIVKGISVGFMPKENGVRKPTKKDKSMYGDAVSRVYSQWKLLEVSVAPLPANGEALVSAIKKGVVSSGDAEKFLNTKIKPKRLITIQLPVEGYLDRLSRLENERKARAKGRIWSGLSR